MHELSRYCFLAGAVPFVVLGAAHVYATPRRPEDRKGLSPADPTLGPAMTRSALLLTRRTDMCRAWVGFNLSHSLGVLIFGTVVLLAGRSEAAFAQEGPVFVPFALLMAIGYAALGVRFWFKIPIRGATLSACLFLAAWVLMWSGL